MQGLATILFSLLKVLFVFIFRERGREGEREGEKHQCVVASCMPPTGDLARNPGMCPDWELNQRTLGSQDDTQSTKLVGFKCLSLGVHYSRNSRCARNTGQANEQREKDLGNNFFLCYGNNWS